MLKPNIIFAADMLGTMTSFASIFLVLMIGMFGICIGGIASNRAKASTFGIPGLMILGALGGFLATKYFTSIDNILTLNPLIVNLIGSAGAFIFGILFSLLYSLLTVKIKSNNKIMGALFNFFCIGLSLFIINFLGKQNIIKSLLSYPNAMPYLTNMTLSTLGLPSVGNLTLNMSMLFTLLFYILFLIVVSKTRFALRLKASNNLFALQAAGISNDKLKVSANVITGIFASLFGFSYITYQGIFNNYTLFYLILIGFISLGIVALCNWKIGFALLDSLLVALVYSVSESHILIDLLFSNSSEFKQNEMDYLIYSLILFVILIIFAIGNLIHKKKNKPLYYIVTE